MSRRRPAGTVVALVGADLLNGMLAKQGPIS